MRRCLVALSVGATVLCAGGAAEAAPYDGRAADRSDPSDAVVFIRVFGTARAEYEDVWKKAVERRGIEVGTGSGFVISPSGYVLTNHHVVSGDDVTVKVEGREISVKVTIERIEVLFASGQRLPATVFASDAEMDLAVLSVNASGLPFVPFGDSDAVESGTEVRALGYPFGQSIEVGRAEAADVVPQVTTSAGSVSAIRNGDDERPRYLQVTSALNAGSSGGPVVDADGYALGVVAMKARKSEGVGFTIAINRVKDFLERCGLDGELLSRRLVLGPPTSMGFKGLRVQMPLGYQDNERGRLQVGASDPGRSSVALQIDRLASPWKLEQVERAFLDGQIVQDQTFEMDARRPRVDPHGALVGQARTTTKDGGPLVMEYAIASTGNERVVARYIGMPNDVAFNRSVLRESLKSLEIEPLLREEPLQPPGFANTESVRWPLNWPGSSDGGPVVCTPKDAPGRSQWRWFDSSVSPLQDFRQTLRMRTWLDAESIEAVGRRCREARAPNGYQLTMQWAGIEYSIRGYFLVVPSRDSRVVQIEGVAPSDRAPKLEEWLREWKALLEKP